MAYVTAHLNIEGDVYQDAADMDIWLTDAEQGGDTLIQDFGRFLVRTIHYMSIFDSR